MIKLKTFVFNPFQENTYVVYDDTKECIVVDAGCYTADEEEALVRFVEDHDLIVKLAVCTHGHVDHILGNAFVKSKFGVPVVANPLDAPLFDTAISHASLYGFTLQSVPGIDVALHHGDEVKFGESILQVIHTPGHSQGGICFLSKGGEFILVGDTLFRGSIGRTDLPGGDYDQLIESIQTRLMSLDPNLRAYPGHGEPTTIGWERQNNPFLR